MNNTVYLDNSSTTAVCPTAVKYINSALGNYGNPSSLHVMGMKAEDELVAARAAVAKMLYCREDEVFFTGSGTESNNTALFGAALSRKKRGNRIVTTTVEHPSVLRVIDRIEELGFETIRLKPNNSGCISAEELKEAINDKTVLVSIMLVNNEVGSVQPVAAAREAIKLAGAPALLHCDAVQAFGKIPCDVKKLGVDLLSASGHKIGGPKGIGILYKKKDVHIQPLILGGGQEGGLRSGTESVPLIAGLRGAIEELPAICPQLDKMRKLRDYTAEKLLSTGFIELNSSPDAIPYILNISMDGFRSETLLHFLERQNIFVSSGSACAKGNGSYVLGEMGLSRSRVDSALRISFCRFNTQEDADRLCEALIQAHSQLRSNRKI